MIHIRPATEWDAPAELSSAGHPMSGARTLVVLHHSYRPHRPCGDALSKERADIRGMDRYHREQGWGGIGYHFAGFQSGNVYQCRPTTRTGAHTVGQNSKSVGYVLVMDGDAYAPSDAAIESFREWLRWAVAGDVITSNYVVRPHSDFADKTCPGVKVTPLIPVMQSRALATVVVLGDRGAAVADVQRLLVRHGYMAATHITGHFGTVTLNALVKFQRDRGLVEDGVVGPKTRQQLER